MKVIKRILFLWTLLFVLPCVVEAGSIQFNKPEKVSNTSYKFTLTVQDMELNHISGNIAITNGTISSIELANGWMSKTGTDHRFYFYHNGISTGNYTIATIYVSMTGNSEYRIQDVDYRTLQCTKDIYGTYFGDRGNVVSESVFQSVCGKSKDASLKSLSISNGTLSPTFSSSLEIYSATVENSVSAVSFSAIPNHNKAKVISGMNCALKVGLTTCKIVVQAEAGNTKTYSVTVVRKGSSGDGWHLSSDASIRDLQVHNGTLTTPFSSSKTEYDVKVSKGVTQISFSFVMNSNGQKFSSDVCKITPDTNKCKLTITASDGVSTKTYSFRILYEGKENNPTEDTKNENHSDTTTNAPSNSGNSSNGSTSPIDKNTVNNGSNISIDDNKNQESENPLDESNQEEHYYTETPQEENTLILPIVNKKVTVSRFSWLLLLTLFLGGFLGIILSKIVKKMVSKKNNGK